MSAWWLCCGRSAAKPPCCIRLDRLRRANGPNRGTRSERGVLVGTAEFAQYVVGRHMQTRWLGRQHRDTCRREERGLLLLACVRLRVQVPHVRVDLPRERDLVEPASATPSKVPRESNTAAFHQGSGSPERRHSRCASRSAADRMPVLTAVRTRRGVADPRRLHSVNSADNCATVHNPRCTGSASISVMSRASRIRRTASTTALGTGASGRPSRTTAEGIRSERSTSIHAVQRTCLVGGRGSGSSDRGRVHAERRDAARRVSRSRSSRGRRAAAPR